MNKHGKVSYTEYCNAMVVVKQYQKEVEELKKEVDNGLKKLHRFSNVTPETILYHTDMSIRLSSVLRHMEDYDGCPIKFDIFNTK